MVKDHFGNNKEASIYKTMEEIPSWVYKTENKKDIIHLIS